MRVIVDVNHPGHVHYYRNFVREMQKKYPDSKLFKNFHGCMLCHVDVKAKPKAMTPYGADYKAAKGKTPAEKFAAIEKLDSDKDKFTNIEEIKAGSNPADPKSTPKNIRPMMSDGKTTGTMHMDAKTTGTAAKSTTQKAVKKAGTRKARKKKAATPRQ
jgi:hypothetical protein